MICPHCSSMDIIKDGKKTRRDGTEVQSFYCKSCGKYFSIPIEHIAPDQAVVESGEVLQLKFDEVTRVHGLTDVHVGAVEHHHSKLKEAVSKIYKDDNARWFGNGDLIECIPPAYKISQRGQLITPDEQVEAFLDAVRPIMDKCLFIRGGNHDYIRSVNALDYDVVRSMAREIGTPYYRLPGYTQIEVSGKKWNLVSGHGKSGAKNGDLELGAMAAVYSQGDVFYLGHNHQLYAKPVDSLIIDNGEERLHRRWYIRGGSFLNYADYARYSYYAIVRTGWVTMQFDKKEIKCWEN